MRTLGRGRTIVTGDVHTVAGESQAEAGELGGGVALVGDALLWLQVRARPDLALISPDLQPDLAGPPA